MAQLSHSTTAKTVMKVFGERNCGTNLAEKMLSAAGVDVLPAGAPKRVQRIARRLAAAQEPALDAWNLSVRGRTMGWKHCYVDDATVDLMRRRNVSGLAFTKHPLSWLVSLRRNPYHVTVDETSGAIVHRPLRRERLPHAPADIIDVWRMKTERYLELDQRGVVHLLRFEDIVVEPEATLQQALDKLGLHAVKLAAPERSVKSDSRSTEEIRAHYTSEAWRAEVSEWDREVASRLQPDLLERLGYAI